MLEKQRNEIDRIDREIVKLFEQRTNTVEEVAQVKLANGKEILDSSREALVIEKVQSYLENPELKDELADLYTEIMRISRGHQQAWMAKQTEK
jgi:chorismate mutase/prephenate dehydratase